MTNERTTASRGAFPQYTLLTPTHREMLEELRFRHRLSFSETIRLGIEKIWSQRTAEIDTRGMGLQA